MIGTKGNRAFGHTQETTCARCVPAASLPGRAAVRKTGLGPAARVPAGACAVGLQAHSSGQRKASGARTAMRARNKQLAASLRKGTPPRDARTIYHRRVPIAWGAWMLKRVGADCNHAWSKRKHYFQKSFFCFPGLRAAQLA